MLLKYLSLLLDFLDERSSNDDDVEAHRTHIDSPGDLSLIA